MLLTPTVFSVKFVFEKNENKQKEAGVGPFFKNNFVRRDVNELTSLGSGPRQSSEDISLSDLVSTSMS